MIFSRKRSFLFTISTFIVLTSCTDNDNDRVKTFYASDNGDVFSTDLTLFEDSTYELIELRIIDRHKLYGGYRWTWPESVYKSPLL